MNTWLYLHTCSISPYPPAHFLFVHLCLQKRFFFVIVIRVSFVFALAVFFFLLLNFKMFTKVILVKPDHKKPIVHHDLPYDYSPPPKKIQAQFISAYMVKD